MTAILTGDIINSRSEPKTTWLQELKSSLNKYGESPKEWEIYRGDSFQLEVKPEEALEAALLLKATIKQYKKLDVRIAIGLGEKSYNTEKITEANGSAFINSGECFDQLKKTTLAIKTPYFDNFEIDQRLNFVFQLGAHIFDNWTSVSAFCIKLALENPTDRQVVLAEKANQLSQQYKLDQSGISRGLQRGGYDDILKIIAFYKKTIEYL